MPQIRFQEKYITQIPALETLIKLGYHYLTPEEALAERDDKTSQVILPGILARQLHRINRIHTRDGREIPYTDANIREAVSALMRIPMNEGYAMAAKKIYERITTGYTVEQTIDGHTSSYTIQYVDWKNPANNLYHLTAEFSVLRANGKDHYRPDIVLFVNGIPFGIIECKRPDMKDALEAAISQHLTYQKDDGIRHLYVFGHILLASAQNKLKYGTTDTPAKFWSFWREQFDTDEQRHQYEERLKQLKNSPLPPEVKDKLFSGPFAIARRYFEEQAANTRRYDPQDEYLYNLYRPERLLELTRDFIIFDNHIKKIARYQQYFAVKKTLQRLKTHHGKRRGGVIWHTQGSGKSLTMVMLAKLIIKDPDIPNPQIVIVTDRKNLDKQIKETFEDTQVEVKQAQSGDHLARLLQKNRSVVITTVVNKFKNAAQKLKEPITDREVIVMVDEGHRTHYGELHQYMRQVLPNAIMIAFTGTPIARKDRHTLRQFGTLIDTYKIDQAVEDGAVVPLLYEARMVKHRVNEGPLDRGIKKLAETLSDEQRADLKKKYSNADMLNKAAQHIEEIAYDISKHFRDNWQGTGFKAQLVTDSKLSAVRFKRALDKLEIVSSEVLISPPSMKEGKEDTYSRTHDEVKQFWEEMMSQYDNAENYEKQIVESFKNKEHPEIIIVVDKLLTGFDEPKNTIMYLTRGLKDHTLLQAIARVNRVAEGKDFGYIIDYYGVLGELDEAMQAYTSLKEFNQEDVDNIWRDIHEEIRKVPELHSQLWDLFKEIKNKKDVEAFQQHLRDDERRHDFYDRLRKYAQALKVALSTRKFYEETPAEKIKKYKQDLEFFLRLRQAVIERYADRVDFKKYEKAIQTLIDRHLNTEGIEVVVKPTDIMDREAFEKELERTQGAAAKADKIASRTSKYIHEKWEEDPAFYRKFSDLLKEIIQAYEKRMIDEKIYLHKVMEIKDKVLSHEDESIPPELRSKPFGRAVFGILDEHLKEYIKDKERLQEKTRQLAEKIDEIAGQIILDQGVPKVDWERKKKIIGELEQQIGFLFLDELPEIDMDFMDELIGKIIELAKRHYKS